jgi:S-adenosylmethionine:tRNA ribosyltransferase-isomerase
MRDRNPEDYSLSAYQYNLPNEKIAQNPVTPRDSSRLLVIDSTTTHQHRIFRELPDILRPGDLLVLNDTRVLPARLYGYKAEGGGQVEILLLEEKSLDHWLALVKPGRRLKPGTTIHFGPNPAEPDLIAQVLETDPETNGRILKFEYSGADSLYTIFEKLGQVPLPPYISDTSADPEQYQTVYAEQPGAVAAPTAGLHFTPELFDRLKAVGIQWTQLTLHVGIGTFRPVETDNILEHKMHGEWIDVPQATVDLIHATKAQGGRVIAVGTTVTRALEGVAHNGTLRPYQGKTDLYIYPGFEFRVLDGLITNFHLPGASLLMLVSALIGRQRLLSLYQTAIEENYRFYSFGDAMLILPESCVEP